MMSVEQLDALRHRYGERLEIFGAPLLTEKQPSAFEGEAPPIPAWYDAEDASTEDSEEDLALNVPETESLDDLEPSEADLGFDDSPESIIEALDEPDADPATTAAAQADDSDVEASDDQVESVLGDLSDVSLEPDDPDPDHSSGGTGGALAIDGGAAAVTDADDPMDDLFDEMKRDIADSEVETGENAGAGRDASIADLVEDGSPGGDERDDVPQDAADLTASELFSSLNEE
jgi:hypothetical protein